MKHTRHPRPQRAGAALALALLALGLAGPALAAGFAVQEIHSPGPAMGMSDNGSVAGFYVAKCTTLSSQPKRTICYHAPWLYDGRQVSKLAGKFPSNANAQAVGVNDRGDLIGADLTGAWYLSGGSVAYVDSSTSGTRGSRLATVNNAGFAVGMSTVGGVYQSISYTFGGAPQPLLGPGYAVVDVNDAGMVAGWFKNGNNVEQAFVTTGAGIVAVPGLDPAVNCRAVRISQVNAATGAVWVAGNCAGNRPFRYEVSTRTLDELRYAGSSNLSVVGIDSRGHAAGTAVKPGAFAPDGYTALWWSADPASPVDLNAGPAFAPAGCWNVHATDLNEAGTVLAGCNDSSGNFYTYLLQPQP